MSHQKEKNNWLNRDLGYPIGSTDGPSVIQAMSTEARVHSHRVNV